MKIIPPQIEIPRDDPFKNDILNRKGFSETLYNLIVRTDDPLVIALDAQWGEGKTTFVKMWKEYLIQEGIDVLYFDAFVHDYIDDAFIAIVSEVYNYFDEILDDQRVKLDNFKKKACKIGSHLLSWTVKLGIKSLTLGIIRESEIDELREIKDDLAKDASRFIGKFIEDRLSVYTKEKTAFLEFKADLKRLISSLATNRSGKFVFIIDELDRCKPTFAVEILERIKHIFSVENMIFVLVMNKEQLEEAIKAVYGRGIDANIYLQKFIDIEVSLRKNERNIYESDYRNYINKLFDTFNLTTFNHSREIKECLTSLALYFSLSLRQLEKVFTNLAIFYGIIPERSLCIPEIVSFLAVIKVLNKKIYLDLNKKQLSFSDIINKLNLLESVDKRGDSNIEFIIRWLKFCLLDQEDFNKLPPDDPAKRLTEAIFRYSINREDIIPFHCEIMNMVLLNK